MDINTPPLWAIILGGSSAALSRAGVRQGDMYFTALTSIIYYADRAGEEAGCVRSEDGCARFLLLTPRPALWKSLRIHRGVHRITFILLTSCANHGPRRTRAAGNSGRHVPGRRCLSALPPWPEKTFLEVIPRVEVPPAAQKENFHFPEGYLQPAERTYYCGRPGGILVSKKPSLLSSASSHHCFFKQKYLYAFKLKK